jgi:hypothetical protein
MPKLLIFAACEKVILDKEHNAASLISVLQTIRVAAPGKLSGRLVPLPLNWRVFTCWEREPSEEGKSYNQHVQLTAPDGTIRVESFNLLEFKQRFQRATIKVAGFPIDQPGDYVLRLFLSEAGKSDEERQIATYPLTVVHSRIEEMFPGAKPHVKDSGQTDPGSPQDTLVRQNNHS